MTATDAGDALEEVEGAPLRLLAPGGGPDGAAAARAVRDLLLALGQDPDRPGLQDTPRRVAQALTEMLSPQPYRLTTFPNEAGYDELVVVRDIGFTSLCEHHLLPFSGVAHVAYLPARRLVGLSKLARVVTAHARGLQVQERLTQQIALELQAGLDARGVGVVLEAEHGCMSGRGVRAVGSATVTSFLTGALHDDGDRRREFLAAVGQRRSP